MLDAVAARLTDRASVRLARTSAVDFQHYPDRVADLGTFLAGAERQAARAGCTSLPGVRGAAVRLER